MKLQFSKNHRAQNTDARTLIETGTLVSKMAMSKYHGDNILATQYSYSEDYDALNTSLKEKILKYCAKRANIEDYDLTQKEDLVKAFTNPTFEWEYFAIQTEVLNSLQSDNEVQEALKLANIVTVGMGDSATFDIASKALYEVQDGAYGNNVTRYQKQFRDSITLTPSPKTASISFDVVQLAAYNYDWGKEVAKIAMSFRTKMYKDIIEKIYDFTVLGSPFYEASFAKSAYVALAERVDAVNGNIGVTAVATKQAWVASAGTVTNGFSTLDEINKTGFIGNLYGVRSVVLEQAVDSNTPAYPFQVPNDRILLISMSAGDKPIKVVKEGNIMVTQEDGRTNSLYERVYKYTDSWEVGLATQAGYGISAAA